MGVYRSAWVCALTIIIVSASAVLAQDPTGYWRVEGIDSQGRLTGGIVHITRDSQGLRYERRSREELSQPIEVETGTARVQSGELFTEATGTSGLTTVIGGATASGWRGRYTLSSTVLQGQRLLGGSARAEHLVRLAPHEAFNDLQLFIDGAAVDAVRDEMRQATRSISVQTFNWTDDATGRSIADILTSKAANGVEVRCLVDARSKTITKLVHGDSVVDFTAGLHEELRRAGIEVILQHGAKEGIRGSLTNAKFKLKNGWRKLRGRPAIEREKRGWTAHDHRKATIVDGRVAFVGGQNIGHDYEFDWHDVQCRIEGPAARRVNELFADRWSAAGGGNGVVVAGAGAPGDLPVEVLGSIPGLPDPIRARYMQLIASAQREILVEMAFFVDEGYIEALSAAAQRNVRVVVVLPNDEKNINWLMRDAFRWVQNDVVRSGVELYKLDRMLHAKLAVFDGRVGTLGSHNMNGTGLAELNIFVPDPRFAREMQTRLFDVDLPQCTRVAVEKTSIGQWFKSLGARILRKII